MNAMADPSNEDPGGGILEIGEPPKIKDTTELGGGIWIILFGFVIIISLTANSLLSVLVVRNRKKHNLVYLMHLLMFAINLVDFSLLIFEFSLGIEHEYPYSQSACTVYQAVVKGNPIIQASAIVVMLFYTAKTYSTQNLPSQTTESVYPIIHLNNKKNNNDDVMAEELQSVSRIHGTVTSCNRRKHEFMKFGGIVVFLVAIECILSVPTALFASIVNVKDQRYCEIDLTSSPFLNINNDGVGDASSKGYYDNANLHQLILCLYYLIYSSILTFWLPLMISIVPAIRLIRDKNRDKHPEVSVVLSTVSSFFIFYVFHATLVFGRHFYDISGHEISAYNLWMVKVGQSLLLLIAYFWNFLRPALALSLDPDLKYDLMKMFNMSDYGSLPAPMNNVLSRGDSRLHQQHHQASFVPYNQDMERRNGKWEIVSGVKHVFTKTILGHKSSNHIGEKNSILIVPLAEIEISTLNEQSRHPFISTPKSTKDVGISMDNEISSALTQTTEQIGENNC